MPIRNIFSRALERRAISFRPAGSNLQMLVVEGDAHKPEPERRPAYSTSSPKTFRVGAINPVGEAGFQLEAFASMLSNDLGHRMCVRERLLRTLDRGQDGAKRSGDIGARIPISRG